MPSRIATRAVISRFRDAESTVVVPPRAFPGLLRDCPPFARVVFVLRVAAPDSTVSLPQGSTVTALCPGTAWGLPVTAVLFL
ncbi:hypothetical protein GCM10010293_25870 [Streptomyces griseoflavus]|nr:hypothetical protein GCM10010293_25870 [Streptomyces griseoflavus]